MGHLIRTILVWLVAIAIPAQGMAAATGFHCSPGHAGMQTSQRMTQPLPEASAPAHAAHGHASHAAPNADAVSDNGPSATVPDTSRAGQTKVAADAVKGAKSSLQKCSACASCCAGLALPSTAIMPPSIDPASAVSVLSQSMVASIFHDGPERPPRILHA